MILLAKIGICLLWMVVVYCLWRAVTKKPRILRARRPVDLKACSRGFEEEWRK